MSWRYNLATENIPVPAITPSPSLELHLQSQLNIMSIFININDARHHCLLPNECCCHKEATGTNYDCPDPRSDVTQVTPWERPAMMQPAGNWLSDIIDSSLPIKLILRRRDRESPIGWLRVVSLGRATRNQDLAPGRFNFHFSSSSILPLSQVYLKSCGTWGTCGLCWIDGMKIESFSWWGVCLRHAMWYMATKSGVAWAHI